MFKFVEHRGTKSGRLAYVDSMRGIAALLVVLMHNVQPVATGPVRTLIYDVVDPGKVGVVMFFTISGFVIPFSFPIGPAALKRFLISRFFRLYPAYWLSMAAYLLLLLAAGTALPSIANIAANVTMVQMALGQANIVGVFWTLFIELLFYMVCVVAFANGWLHRPKFTLGASLFCLSGAAIFAVARFYLERKVPVAVPLSLSVMFWGTLWREALVNNSRVHRTYAYVMIAVFLVSIPIISGLAYDIDLGLTENWIRYTISYLAGIGLFIIFSTKIRVSGQIFIWLGTISYSLYLFHVHARDAMQMAFAAAGINAPDWVGIMLAIGAAVGLAALVFAVVERPLIGLGRRVGTMAATRQQLATLNGRPATNIAGNAARQQRESSDS